WPLIRWNPSSLTFRREIVLERVGVFHSVLTGADSEYCQRLYEAFGHRRIRSLGQPLSLAASRPDSLVGSAATGFGRTGVNFDRLAYWESWHLWHAAVVAAAGTPRVGPGQTPFDPPASIRVQPPSYATDFC
ncbi:MAG TPA: hypothetical protein VES39_12600, partial [Rhodospirillales bacterium]|nr:hypothetical protein [Rhodospirillales bacterium]